MKGETAKLTSNAAGIYTRTPTSLNFYPHKFITVSTNLLTIRNGGFIFAEAVAVAAKRTMKAKPSKATHHSNSSKLNF